MRHHSKLSMQHDRVLSSETFLFYPQPTPFVKQRSQLTMASGQAFLVCS